MAQDDGNESWWSSWTTGILENVREKTSSAMEFVQNDLSEFVTTIQHDASVAIADSAKVVNSGLKIEDSEKEETTGKIKQGFSNLLTSISSKLDHSLNESVVIVPSSSESEGTNNAQTMSVVYDRTQARLQEIQSDPGTYRDDPECDAYRDWCDSFDLDEKKGEISDLLVNNTDVRRLYTKFVPIVQSHSTFWHRYFYKVHAIEMENQRLADIVARANSKDDTDLGWDDDDDDDDDVEVLEDNALEMRVPPLNTPSSSSHSGSHQEEKTQSIGSSSKDDSASDEKHRSDECDDVRVKEKTIVTTENADKELCDKAIKCEEEKSDSSDSNSWIRVSEKEGSSTNSSSSVMIVNEKEKELIWDDDNDDEQNDDNDDEQNDDNDDEQNDDNDLDFDVDDDNDLDLNEEITNEDVEKLVHSLTTNKLESDEDDWENWE